jgi:hypothetical protein
MLDNETITESRRPAVRWSTAVPAWTAMVLAGAALAVSLIHGGTPGATGPQGVQGPQGSQGQTGPAGAPAPVLGYQCQMDLPLGTSSGTLTTFYWPCHE